MATSSNKHQGVPQPADAQRIDDVLKELLAPFLAQYPQLQIVIVSPDETSRAGPIEATPSVY